jgi:hypothetical protein
MENLETIIIRFDNAGGIQLLSPTYAHDYYGNFPYERHAADDVLLLLNGADLSDFDGNDADILAAHLADEPYDNDTSVSYKLTEIAALIAERKIMRTEDGVEVDGKHISGHAQTVFFLHLY